MNAIARAIGLTIGLTINAVWTVVRGPAKAREELDRLADWVDRRER